MNFSGLKEWLPWAERSSDGKVCQTCHTLQVASVERPSSQSAMGVALVFVDKSA